MQSVLKALQGWLGSDRTPPSTVKGHLLIFWQSIQ